MKDEPANLATPESVGGQPASNCCVASYDYTEIGNLYEWRVACAQSDTVQALLDHFSKYRPGASLIAVTITVE